MFTVTVYSKPNCVQCTATTRELDKREVSYTVVDLTTSDELLTWVTQELGHQQAPWSWSTATRTTTGPASAPTASRHLARSTPPGDCLLACLQVILLSQPAPEVPTCR